MLNLFKNLLNFLFNDSHDYTFNDLIIQWKKELIEDELNNTK